MTVSDRRLRQLVTEDRRIEQEAQSKTLALMEHRWKAVQETGSLRSYAKALGRSHVTVGSYVRGWERWQEESGRGAPTTRTPNEVLELANMGQDEATATEAVAKAKGRKVSQVRKEHRGDVERVRRAMAKEPDPEKKPARAQRLAEQMEETRRKSEEKVIRQNGSQQRVYYQVERELDKARRALSAALRKARDAEFDDDMVEMLTEQLAKTRSLLELVNMAIVGAVDIDWDVEFEKMEV